jgi:hypothetical protein
MSLHLVCPYLNYATDFGATSIKPREDIESPESLPFLEVASGSDHAWASGPFQ